MSFDFGTDKAEKEYGVGGPKDLFAFEEGPNKVRILAVDEGFLATHFVNKRPFVCAGEEKGCPYHGKNTIVDDEGKPRRPSVKKLMYVWNYRTGKIEMAYMPYSVIKALSELAKDEEWTFEGMPMPYDITIKFTEKGAPAEMYKVTPSAKRMDVSEGILGELFTKKPLSQIRETIQAKQSPDPVPPPPDDLGPMPNF